MASVIRPVTSHVCFSRVRQTLPQAVATFVKLKNGDDRTVGFATHGRIDLDKR